MVAVNHGAWTAITHHRLLTHFAAEITCRLDFRLFS